MEIKELRNKMKMSQRQFAEYFGIPIRTIQCWEIGQRKPPDYIPKLLKRLWREELERKTNNPSWCIDKIQEKIEDYKVNINETTDEEVRRQLEIIVSDLEEILYE